MRKIIFLLLIIILNQYAWTQPLPVKLKHAIIIDTDCAIDDMRAICYLLARPEITIKGILLSDGSLTPEEGSKKVRSLLHEFKNDSIPVACGDVLKGINPPWRQFNSQISWGTETTDRVTGSNAVDFLAERLRSTDEKIIIVCLGPLTNIAQLIKKDATLLSRIERIIWYNDSVKPLAGFNYDCDKQNANMVFNSNVRIDVISNLNKDRALFDTSLYNVCRQSKNLLATILYNVHSQEAVSEKLKQNHFRLYDDLVALYLTNPELFDINTMTDNLKVRYNKDYNAEGVKEAIADMITGNYFPERNVVFNRFPVHREMFNYDVRPIIDSAISRYGYEEWKANVMTDEFHGHLGVFSIVGAKMGIKARELFGVGPDMLDVITYAGTRPPYSCLNDGIQVSTGATLGMGTIHLAADSITRPSAVFTYKGRSVRISLKKEYFDKVDADINEGIVKFGLMDDGYWKLIRHNAIKYWVEWDRNKIFDIVDEGISYYLSPSGDDNNPGSKVKPWKTLAKINTSDLNPGDIVLLEGGAVFQGTLVLDSLDSGGGNGVVTIGSYGNGRAIIDGANSEGIIVRNCSHFLIKELVVKGAGRKEGNVSDGIYITSSKYFLLDSLELSGFQHSGLHIRICSNVKIKNVYAHNNGFAGIHVTGTTIYDTAKYDNENIYIGHCIAENNPGDPTVKDNHSGNGILASSVRRGTIEYCEAFNNGWDMPWTGNGPVGIWIWDCRDIVIQYCIAHDNKTRTGAGDGGGFDLDGGVSNSVIQYCFSYNNQGAGYGLFEFGAAKPWENNIIRYNISQNDAIFNTGSVAVWKGEAGVMRNCEIYNNTFYNNTSRGYTISFYNNWPGFRFRNNIFIYKGSFLIPGQKLGTELFQANSYFSLTGDKTIAGYRNLQEWANATGNEMINNRFIGIFDDPGLQNPGNCSLADPGKLNPVNLASYSLKPGSPLIDQGLNLNKLFKLEPGTKDIAGKPVPQGKGYDIGAMEY